MAATLAAGGKNPVTGKQVMSAKNVPYVLAVMATAGLYDDTGKWLYHTGLPAKSGVGGGIIAVAPGKFGIAVVSPPLDDAGNSVKAQKAIRDIVAQPRRQPVRGEGQVTDHRGAAVGSAPRARLTRHDGVPVVQRSRPPPSLSPRSSDALPARRVGALVQAAHSPSCRPAARYVPDRGPAGTTRGAGRPWTRGRWTQRRPRTPSTRPASRVSFGQRRASTSSAQSGQASTSASMACSGT